MANKLDACTAMDEYLGPDKRVPLVLRILNNDMAEELETRYVDQYLAARDGGESSPEEKMEAMFSPLLDGKEYVPTKGDVLVAWRYELQEMIPRAIMQDCTRDEALSVLNFLYRKHVDGMIVLQVSPGFRYHAFDLMRGWNETHPDETPIKYQPSSDWLP